MRTVRQKHPRLAHHANNPLVQAFATRLRQWRKERGITLKNLAADIGLSIPIICEWEHGHRFPSVQNLQALANYTKIPASTFLRPLEAPKLKKPRRATGR